LLNDKIKLLEEERDELLNELHKLKKKQDLNKSKIEEENQIIDHYELEFKKLKHNNDKLKAKLEVIVQEKK